jgi:hypothetical protein
VGFAVLEKLKKGLCSLLLLGQEQAVWSYQISGEHDQGDVIRLEICALMSMPVSEKKLTPELPRN